jgi:hypothetical protein
MGLVGVPTAQAQTNIDQGKSASELFANYCVVCHKNIRGLANGRSALTLSLFLREHYAASREQAASLAAYVISAGGNAPAPAKPERARTDEPKNQEPKGQEAKGHDPKTRSSSASAKPEADKPAKGRQPGRDETAPPEQEAAPVAAAPAPAPSGALDAAAPASPEARPGTSTGASTESQATENEPVPRDNIPD